MSDTRMAGDALAKGGRKMTQLEQRLGTDEFKRIGAEGQQAATDAGKWSAAEVKAEFRNAGSATVDEGENSVLKRFQDIQANGGKFNRRAQDFLSSKYGFDFTKNNSNDGNSTDGTNTGGEPGNNTGGGTQPGDGNPTQPLPETPTTANPGTGTGSGIGGARGGDASNTNKNENTIGDVTVNGDGNNIHQEQNNYNYQQSFGGDAKNFTYIGGGSSGGSGTGGPGGLYDTPASMATMAGYWGPDDSPASGQKFLSSWVGGNKFQQSALRADYDARTNTDYASQAAEMNQFNPQNAQYRIDSGHYENRDLATVNFAKAFGDTAQMPWNWERTTAPEPIDNKLEEIADKYNEQLD